MRHDPSVKGFNITGVWINTEYNMICVERNDRFSYQVIDLDAGDPAKTVVTRTEAPGTTWHKLDLTANPDPERVPPAATP